MFRHQQSWIRSEKKKGDAFSDLRCFPRWADLHQTCSWWSAWGTGTGRTGRRCSPCRGGGGASAWGLEQWAWRRRCHSTPAGCLWIEAWGGCEPVGLGYVLVGRWKRKKEKLRVTHHRGKTFWSERTYLLELGEVSLTVRSSLEEVTFLNWACSQGYSRIMGKVKSKVILNPSTISLQSSSLKNKQSSQKKKKSWFLNFSAVRVLTSSPGELSAGCCSAWCSVAAGTARWPWRPCWS